MQELAQCLYSLISVGSVYRAYPKITIRHLSPAVVAGSPNDDSHVATGMLVKVVWIKGPAALILPHCGTGRRCLDDQRLKRRAYRAVGVRIVDAGVRTGSV